MKKCDCGNDEFVPAGMSYFPEMECTNCKDTIMDYNITFEEYAEHFKPNRPEGWKVELVKGKWVDTPPNQDQEIEVDKMTEEASLRTKVLIEIREFERNKGRGIKFDELVSMSEIERATVSKSLDSLDDMNMIIQNPEPTLLDGFWVKLITTNPECREFIDNSIDEMLENGIIELPSGKPSGKKGEGSIGEL